MTFFFLHMEEQFLDTVYIVDHEARKRCHGCIKVPKLKLKGNPEGTRDARQWSFFGSEIVQIGWSVILNQYHLGLNIPQIYGTARILTHTLQSPELLGLSFGPWDKLRYLQKRWIRRHMVMVVGNILDDLGFFHFENEWFEFYFVYFFRWLNQELDTFKIFLGGQNWFLFTQTYFSWAGWISEGTNSPL